MKLNNKKFVRCKNSDVFNNNENEISERKINNRRINFLLRKFPSPNETKTKYLLMQIPKHWNGDCGGLANQMWRFAVLYSLAKSAGRFPGISNTSTWTCDKLNSPREIEKTFPLYHAFQHYFNVEDTEEAIYDRTFEDHCCKYYDPKILEKYTEKYLIIAPPPQSPKYLFYINKEIRELFRFSDNIQKNVDNMINELFESDRSHKLCVYTRRGDFTKPKWKDWHKASDINFTEKGIEYILENELKFENFGSSVILLGEDKEFLLQLNITNMVE